MELLSAVFLSVPMILFIVIVAPLWILMHYRSVNRSASSLNDSDRELVEQMLVTVDKLTDRIEALEAILDAEHRDWRTQTGRGTRNRSE
ncbi:MAG: envelope stress response membrane protein PspB [Parahaliea sp.]